MSTQRYERLSATDEEDVSQHHHRSSSIPNSPPPSFRSRSSSIAPSHAPSEHDRLVSDADRTLADTFDSPSDDENDDDHVQSRTRRLDDRQRAMNGRPTPDTTPGSETTESTERHATQLPASTASPPTTTIGRVVGAGSNDGVFANLSAKLLPGEEVEEKPPTYEQAAADSAPPYWETTILAPGATGDEVYIDGLPVGSLFSFIWNAMISMSFQLVGFLLTYLLHTTHAAKHGSKAGLGITLIQYGFTMRSSLRGGNSSSPGDASGGSGGTDFVKPPSDPNAHTFDPVGGGADANAPQLSMTSGDWFAYAIMIVGWFILIRSVAEYVKARRHEQLVLQSPSRGLNAPIVASGERPETSV